MADKGLPKRITYCYDACYLRKKEYHSHRNISFAFQILYTPFLTPLFSLPFPHIRLHHRWKKEPFLKMRERKYTVMIANHNFMLALLPRLSSSIVRVCRWSCIINSGEKVASVQIQLEFINVMKVGWNFHSATLSLKVQLCLSFTLPTWRLSNS